MSQAGGGPPHTLPERRLADRARENLRDDAVVRRRALLVARVAIGLYLLELLLNLLRPKVLPDEPALSLFQETEFAKVEGSPFSSFDRLLAMPEVVFWTVMAGIVVGTAIQLYAAVTRPRGARAARLTWATIVAMLGPFGLLGLTVVAEYPVQALVCVPGTAFVLVVLHNVQRFARIPASMLLVAFAWGALIVFGLGRAFGNLAFGTLYNHLIKGAGNDPGAMMDVQYRALDILVLHLSVVNALAVGAGVVLMLLLFRRHVTDAMTGLVLGAAVGLGYTLVESALIIKVFGLISGLTGTTGGFEYWIRQSVGLLGGQVTFGALLGAGLALAARAAGRRRWFLVAGAFAIGIGGPAATEVLAGWWSGLAHERIDTGGAFDTLVAAPLIWLLPQSPFIVLAVLMLRSGRRARAAAARGGVRAGAPAGGLAITRAEEPFLIDPSLRFWTLVATWRRYGRAAATALLRLQSAQLELAGWHLRRQESGGDPETQDEGSRLRARVMRLKTSQSSGPVSR